MKMTSTQCSLSCIASATRHQHTGRTGSRNLNSLWGTRDRESKTTARDWHRIPATEEPERKRKEMQNEAKILMKERCFST